jgi:hypothetical protein
VDGVVGRSVEELRNVGAGHRRYGDTVLGEAVQTIFFGPSSSRCAPTRLQIVVCAGVEKLDDVHLALSP